MTRKELAFAVTSAIFAAGCGGGVGSPEDAERAYQGLDASIDKAIDLGFDGFNAATNANIDPQTADGDISGTLTIVGQVDQGASDNKTMSLTEELIEYSDEEGLTYDTEGALPLLDMKLSMIPDGTLDGTLVGTFTVSGDLAGPVELNLVFTGGLQPGSGTLVEREPGTTRITGTAESDFGVYEVDITR
jgi:hypothetical protein